MNYVKETFDDVVRWNRQRRRALASCLRTARLCRRIARCCRNRRCREPFCAKCARMYRNAATKNFEALLDGQELVAVTILLKKLEAGYLSDYLPVTAKQRVKKILQRIGFTCVVGAVEASWKPFEKVWVVHAHLIIGNPKPDQVNELRKLVNSWEIDGGFQCKEVDDDRRSAISYASKFFTYYKVGRYRKFPLRGALLEELALWHSSGSFADHRVMIGGRFKNPWK